MAQITLTITFLATFFGLLLGLPGVSDACTSFAVFSNSVYYGMNFDFADVPLKLVIAANGDIRTFHLAFERTLSGLSFFVNTAGMNDKGLFAACHELHPENLHPRAKTETDLFTFELYDAIASCASVGEIETLCRRRPLVDMPGITLHNLFADTLGRAIVTEAGENETVVVEKSGSFMVMTNFPIGSMDGKHYREAQGKGAERYITCHEYLDQGGLHFNVENGFELLSMCRNTDPQYPTACSMVFDPQHRDVYIALKMDFSKMWKLSIGNNRIQAWRGFKNDLNISVPIGDQGIAVSDLLTHAESQEG
jgi:hypothetical protein